MPTRRLSRAKCASLLALLRMHTNSMIPEARACKAEGNGVRCSDFDREWTISRTVVIHMHSGASPTHLRQRARQETQS